MSGLAIKALNIHQSPVDDSFPSAVLFQVPKLAAGTML